MPSLDSQYTASIFSFQAVPSKMHPQTEILIEYLILKNKINFKNTSYTLTAVEIIAAEQSPALAAIQTLNCGKANMKQIIGNSNT